MSRCCFCLVKLFLEKNEGVEVDVQTIPSPINPHFPDGVDIFFVPKGEALNTKVGADNPQWIMWAGELGESCACD